MNRRYDGLLTGTHAKQLLHLLTYALHTLQQHEVRSNSVITSSSPATQADTASS